MSFNSLNPIFFKNPDFKSLIENINNAPNNEIPDSLKKEIIYGPLEQMAKKGEAVFGNRPKEDIFNSKAFQDFISKEFFPLIQNIQKEAAKFPPNVIATCGVNEAAFTHAGDKKPIVVTDSLATCIGVAGYVPENKCGFVIHFATEFELEASKDLLTTKIKQIAKGSPVQLHLRGGIAEQSEPLLEEIEKWVKLASEEDCLMEIASKEVLQKGLLNSSGLPNTMSISLDTRDGRVSTYSSSENPFDEQKNEIKNEKELEDVFFDIFERTALSNPEIKITYFPFK